MMQCSGLLHSDAENEVTMYPGKQEVVECILETGSDGSKKIVFCLKEIGSLFNMN